ncbi:biopolymer transporter ExbD [Aureibaculum sp. 2210JD6-5]|uniref:ExbD/TolR family protein n=1 Tax=Aureibaculum sp. 2210JD6-5 TaxID=3103957 RepID=UPI002AAD778A|nr:biopolymer transporter ExbD [Aureibaculum sp. 2210JD6-5]MDY7396015.1 biopolymer transporter ExbD [Aureibaculum sp. 2210JD6-5]
MAKFGKKKKGMPAVNTAALPDIVFMLLFFFMVTTVMRETELKIQTPKLPSADQVKKLEKKSLVSYIYVGKAKDGTPGDKIQLNDRISSVSDIKSFIYAERAQHPEQVIPTLTTSIKADIKSNVGTITDIKQELRDVNALKVNYSTTKGSAMDNIK